MSVIVFRYIGPFVGALCDFAGESGADVNDACTMEWNSGPRENSTKMGRESTFALAEQYTNAGQVGFRRCRNQTYIPRFMESWHMGEEEASRKLKADRGKGGVVSS